MILHVVEPDFDSRPESETAQGSALGFDRGDTLTDEGQDYCEERLRQSTCGSTSKLEDDKFRLTAPCNQPFSRVGSSQPVELAADSSHLLD